MGKIIDAIERTVFGATAQERVDMMAELAARRVEQIIIAVLDPAPERLCVSCGGEGYVLDVWPHEKPCEACGGSGLREGSGGDGR